ncbi:MAG TPA: UvrB/UvrC motif-containing protein [Phycisphaerales bacterium]|nr:UvrB/UvrC motif-containing protein [Phycisphaerales bacterium]
MKCQKCDNEATVHEVMIRGGKQIEKHLCETCAKGEGFVVQSKGEIAQLLTQFLSAQTTAAGGAVTGTKNAVCPTCGTTYAQFRSSGLLGCPDCYSAFEAQLVPLLQRAHEGGVRHEGKTPRRAPAPVAPAPPRSQKPSGPRVVTPPGGVGPAQLPAAGPERPASAPPGVASTPQPSAATQAAAALRELRARLDEAVRGERYEEAALLRDQLRALESAPAPADPAPAPRPGGAQGGGVSA